MTLNDHPISNVEWIPVNDLDANDYNPNSVDQPEMALLALSLLKQKWVQPILVWPNPETPGRFEIIDGFHRHLVTKTNKAVWAMTAGLIPVVKMPMSRPDRMLLTIRINRAKGTHAAVSMHKIVWSLVHEHGYTPERVGEEIGAAADEITTLLARDVFEAKQVDRFQYSRSWFPKGVEVHGQEDA